MLALNFEGWIAQKGTRPAKVKGDSILYEMTLKGKAALMLDEVNLEEFLKIATADQLTQFIGFFSDHPKAGGKVDGKNPQKHTAE